MSVVATVLIRDRETRKVHELPIDTPCVVVAPWETRYWLLDPVQDVAGDVVVLGDLCVGQTALVYDDDTTFWRPSEVVPAAGGGS